MKEKLLSFSEFETLYESYGFLNEEVEAEVPKATSPELQVVNPQTSLPKEEKDPVEDLLAIFSEVEAKAETEKPKEVNEDDEDPTDNPPTEEPKADVKDAAPSKGDKKEAEPAKPAVKVKRVKVTQTPLVKALSLKNIKLGEVSPRVKEVQKVLGIEQSGKFDKATYLEVKKFQKAYDLHIDGIVGVQTYGALLQVKRGIEDMAEIQKLIEALGKLTPFIVLDPRFYGVTKNVTIVTVNNITYVIVIPSDNAKAGVEQMKKDGVLTSGFEWLGKIAEAVGKALVYTAAGLVLLPLVAATTLISAAVSVVKFAAKGIYSVCSDMLTGLKQLGNWAKTKIVNAWDAIKKGGAEVASLVGGFAKAVGSGLKSSAEGLIALAGALGAGLAKVGQGLAQAAWAGIKVFGSVLKGAWDVISTGANALVDATKKGISWLGDRAKELASTVKSGVSFVLDAAKELGQTAISGVKNVVKGATQLVGGALKFTGDLISGAGSWLTGIFESLYEETGNPLYESLILVSALD